MSRDTQNVEGLTFEEWVCAAGVAAIDDGSVGVLPYTSSYVHYHFAERKDWNKDTVLLLCHGNTIPRGIPKRRTVTYYPKKVREAWKRGEDPTEWRA